ncbi:MAG TPA: DUF1697 domain-containing protein [Vicinamibacterales bacterium]|nr:DUF1697 domain-containing protein [Vicinamibacterales bacterium]
MQTTYIALLRAVNLAGHQTVSMTDLRDLLAGLGFADVRSLLQSGNLVFKTKARPCAGLERLLETEAAKQLALDTDFFARTAGEWQAVVGKNPFRKEAERDPGHFVLACLKDAPGGAQVKGLKAAIAGREVVQAAGRHLYIVYPDGIGRSRLTTALIEKKLETRATGRNWNTVLKLLASASAR